ncbi:hypothetical protein ACWCXB_33905 [Streptomyces sp. NPDC001514]
MARDLDAVSVPLGEQGFDGGRVAHADPLATITGAARDATQGAARDAPQGATRSATQGGTQDATCGRVVIQQQQRPPSPAPIRRGEPSSPDPGYAGRHSTTHQHRKGRLS